MSIDIGISKEKRLRQRDGMRRRMAAAFLAACLLMTYAAESLAESTELPQAVPVCAYKRFEELPGYTVSGAEWELEDHGTEALFAYMATLERSSQVAGLYFSLSGDRDTGVIAAYMHVFRRSARALEPFAVSISTGGDRYDLEGVNTQGSRNGFAYEELLVPLDKTGMEMWEKMASCGEATLILHGIAFSEELHLLHADRPQRNQDHISNACLASIKRLYGPASSVLNEDYRLWDLTKRDAQKRTGEVLKATAFPGAAEEPLLMTGSNGENVRILEEKLALLGYFAGPADMRFDERTAGSVRHFQKAMGLAATGAADSGLSDLLDQGATEAPEIQPAEKAEAVIGGVRWRMDRAWTARTVYASQSDSILGCISTPDGDHLLLIADGQAQNTSDGDVTKAFSAELLSAGHAPVTGRVLFEADAGMYLRENLPAGALRRTVWVFEIPVEWLQSGMQYRVQLSLDTESALFEGSVAP